MRRTQTCLALIAVGALAAVSCSKEGGKAADETAPPAAAKADGKGKAGEKAAEPGAGAAKAAPAEGKPRVEGKGFVVEVKAPPAAAPGAEAAAEVVLTATGEYHLNKEFPTVLDVAAPDGVDCPKLKLTVDDAASFEEKQATWKVACTAKDAGEKKFSASFRFAVCTETTCDPKKESLAWALPVK